MSGRAGAAGRVPWGTLAVGIALLAAGLAAAWRTLPEWREVRSGLAAVEAARAQVKALGGTLAHPKPVLRSAPQPYQYERAFRVLGGGAASYLDATGGAIGWRVLGDMTVDGAGSGAVELCLAPDGDLRRIEWTLGSLFSVAQPDAATAAVREAVVERILDRLAAGDARTGSDRLFESGNAQIRVWGLETGPGRAPEVLVRVLATPSILVLSRELRDPEAGARSAREAKRGLAVGLPVLGAIVLFVAVRLGILLFRRRVGFRIGLRIGLVALGAMVVTGSLFEASGVSGLVTGFAVAGRLCLVGVLVLLWSVAESTLRDTVPGFKTSLDVLLAGRLGPRPGRALLGGLGIGAAIAGLRLAFASASASALLPGFSPEKPSFLLPLFGGLSNPFLEGPYEAALFALFAAVARWALPRERADVLGAIGYGLFYSTSFLYEPWLAGFALTLGTAAFLLFAFRTYGFTALLVSATSAALVRDALVSFRFPAGNAMALLLTGASLLALAVLGVIAIRRSEREDEAKVDAPEYVRRLESEKRVKYEMDLLSQMQLALLPERPPDVPGLEIAARTVLATEAGGDLYDFHVDEGGELWVAAGDVSGHGYSCGIQAAMVKASFASLARAGVSPARVLSEIDRVLRMGRAKLFTSLTLLRLDPKTGRVVLANAGHPFPLVLTEGRCREIDVPALPLGLGPARTYADVELTLSSGATLLVASDGLFEGPNAFDEPYGFDRPRAVLEGVGLWRRPAEAILEAVVADWRLHVGAGPPADDTTVVTLRRPALSW